MKAHNGGQQDLLPEGERIDADPKWFRDALAQTPASCRVAFQDSQLHYLKWQGPAPDTDNLVLLHGGGAHARWFSFIAPLMTKFYNVISLDLPGMGDSGWLQKYNREIIAEAIITMTRDAAFGGKPAFICHSMGGMLGLTTAHHYTDELAAIMICDFHVKPLHAHEEWYMERQEDGSLKPRPPQSKRFYSSFEEALDRFRLLPEQPCANQFIIDYIGAHSLIETAEGWTWKFDPSIYRDFPLGDDWIEIYQNLPLPLAAMFGELSHDFETISRDEVIAFMAGLRPDAPHFDLLGAHHHVMLDQPLAFSSAIVQQMKSWRAQGAFDG